FVDAVGCAVVIQRRTFVRNAGLEEDKRIIFRIGINVGDIIIDEDDIYGDGVNIAARLEALCEPGGLCISRAANEQIRDKLSLAFRSRRAGGQKHYPGGWYFRAGRERNRGVARARDRATCRPDAERRYPSARAALR